MPQAIPFIIAGAKAIAVKLAIALAANAVIGAINRALAGDPPDPEQSKAPIKQPIPPVRVGFGRDRMSGPYLFWATVDGFTLDVVATAQGPVDAFEGFYLNDDYIQITDSAAPLTISATGLNPNKVVSGTDGRYAAATEIYWQVGADPATAFARVVALSGGLWTTTHRGDGAATMALVCKAVKAEDLNKVFPNYSPELSAVGRWSKVYDWRLDTTAGGDGAQRRDDPATWAWSQNAVVCHVHDEWFNGGQDWAYRFAPTLAQLTVAADVADEAIPLKAGGTEPRYVVSGWYELNNAYAPGREKFLQCYDGFMVERGDGAFVIRAGKYYDPTVVLDEDRILEFGWRRSRRAEDSANKLVVAFKSPDHGYTVVEADPWLDQPNIDLNDGVEVSAPFERNWVPHNGQARRLAKRAMSRLKSHYQGFVTVSLSDEGDELEERYLRLRNRRGPPSMFDTVVEVVGVTLDLAKRRVRFDVIQADPDVDEWNPATEEGNAPDVPPAPPPQTIGTPVIESAEIFYQGGTPRVRLMVTDPERADYGYAVRWRSDDPDFLSYVVEYPEPATPVAGQVELNTGPVPPDATILVSVAFIAATGATGPYTLDESLGTTAVPGTPTNVDAVDLGATSPPESSASVTFRFPVTPVAYVRLHQNTVNDYGTASAVPGDQTGALGGDSVPVVVATGTGTFYFWATAYDASDAPGVPGGPASVTVT